MYVHIYTLHNLHSLRALFPNIKVWVRYLHRKKVMYQSKTSIFRESSL